MVIQCIGEQRGFPKRYRKRMLQVWPNQELGNEAEYFCRFIPDLYSGLLSCQGFSEA